MCQLHMLSPDQFFSGDHYCEFELGIGFPELATLITNEAYVEFTLDMLEKKLQSLDSAAACFDYEPESVSSVDLADCLVKLWTCFVQRICGSDTSVPQLTCYRDFFDSTRAEHNNDACNIKFLERTYRYIQLSQLSWRYFASTGGTDAECSCDRLVNDERAQYTSDHKRQWLFSHTLGCLDSSPPDKVISRFIAGLGLSKRHVESLSIESETVLWKLYAISEKDKAVVYWKLVANLVRTVKLHLPVNQPLSEETKTKRDNECLCAAKICNELLQLVSLVLTSRRHPVDILSLVEPRRKHELIQWLYDLASHEFVSTPTSAAIGLGCTIYKLISCLTAQSTTNAHLMKDLALDIYNCRANQAKGTFSKQLWLEIV